MSQTSALFQLGMDLDPGSSTAQKEDWGITRESGFSQSDARYDHFTVKDGVRCAGTHLILDLYDAQGLDDLALMERALRDCVDESGATLLHIHLHHFTPNGGISGVAVLAESHISVHSWPETGYAAFDVFMCGDAEPERCIEVLRAAFSPVKLAVSEHLRGQGA
ncbi:MAG: adenosylmethionine decarboxylase [Pseudomonadota bacterium]